MLRRYWAVRRSRTECEFALTGPCSKEGFDRRQTALGGISKHGSRCVCPLPVHCARSGPETLARRSDGLGNWLLCKSVARLHAQETGG